MNQCTSACNLDQTITSDENNIIEQGIRLANGTSTKDTCTNLMLYPDGTNKAINVEHENNRKRHIGVEGDYSEELEWKITKFFRLVTKHFFFEIRTEIHSSILE